MFVLEQTKPCSLAIVSSSPPSGTPFLVGDGFPLLAFSAVDRSRGGRFSTERPKSAIGPYRSAVLFCSPLLLVSLSRVVPFPLGAVCLVVGLKIHGQHKGFFAWGLRTVVPVLNLQTNPFFFGLCVVFSPCHPNPNVCFHCSGLGILTRTNHTPSGMHQRESHLGRQPLGSAWFDCSYCRRNGRFDDNEEETEAEEEEEEDNDDVVPPFPCEIAGWNLPLGTHGWPRVLRRDR